MYTETTIIDDFSVKVVVDSDGKLLFSYFGSLYQMFKDAEMWRINSHLLDGNPDVATKHLVTAEIDWQKVSLLSSKLK